MDSSAGCTRYPALTACRRLPVLSHSYTTSTLQSLHLYRGEVAHVSPESDPLLQGTCTTVQYEYMAPWARTNQTPKLHLDRFSHFCRIHGRDQQTDRQTTLPVTSVAIGHTYTDAIVLAKRANSRLTVIDFWPSSKNQKLFKVKLVRAKKVNWKFRPSPERLLYGIHSCDNPIPLLYGYPLAPEFRPWCSISASELNWNCNCIRRTESVPDCRSNAATVANGYLPLRWRWSWLDWWHRSESTGPWSAPAWCLWADRRWRSSLRTSPSSASRTLRVQGDWVKDSCLPAIYSI